MARGHAFHKSAPDWDQDSICCEAVHADEDIYYKGSDDEHYDSPVTRKNRYKAAAQRFLDGDAPLILSASLKGPFDASSGWKNPWQSRSGGHKSSANPSGPEQHNDSEPTAVQLPSPSSVTPTVQDTHPYMTDGELVIVSEWRQHVQPATPAKNEFWCPDSQAPSSAKKRRAKGSEWLKKGSNKRRRTREVESPVANTPSLQRSRKTSCDHRRQTYLQPSMTKSSSQKARSSLVKALGDIPDELSYDGTQTSSPIHKRSYHVPDLCDDGYGSGDELSQEKVEADLRAAATLSSPVSQKGRVPRMVGPFESSPLKLQLQMQDDEENAAMETGPEKELEDDNASSSGLSSVGSAICNEVEMGEVGILLPLAQETVGNDAAAQESNDDLTWSGLSTQDDSMSHISESHPLEAEGVEGGTDQLNHAEDVGGDSAIAPVQDKLQEAHGQADDDDTQEQAMEVDETPRKSADCLSHGDRVCNTPADVIFATIENCVEDIDGYDSDHVLHRPSRSLTVKAFRSTRRQRAASVPLIASPVAPSMPSIRGRFWRNRQKQIRDFPSLPDDISSDARADVQELAQGALSLTIPNTSSVEVTAPDANACLDANEDEKMEQFQTVECQVRPSSPLSSLDEFDFAEVGSDVEERVREMAEPSSTPTETLNADSMDSLPESGSQGDATLAQSVEAGETETVVLATAESAVIPASQRDSWARSQGLQAPDTLLLRTADSQTPEDIIPSTPDDPMAESPSITNGVDNSYACQEPSTSIPTLLRPSTPKTQPPCRPLSYFMDSPPKFQHARQSVVNSRQGCPSRLSILKPQYFQPPGKHVTWATRLVQSEDGVTLGESEMSQWEKRDGYERPRAASPPPKAIQDLPTEENDNFSSHFQTIAKRREGGQQQILPDDSQSGQYSPTPMPASMVRADISPATDGVKQIDPNRGTAVATLRAKSPDVSQPDTQDLMDMTNDVFDDIENMMQMWDVDAELDAEREKTEMNRMDAGIGLGSSWML